MRPALILALLPLAACAPGGTRSFADIGAIPSGFGSATLGNTLVQSGQRSAAESLARRFAAEVPAVVTFAFNSAALDAEAQAALAAQAAFIRAFPEVRFSVTGHADLVGSESYNQSLALARARAAVAFLVGQGVDASRLEALVSEGETQPVVATQAPEERNRRAVTTVMGFVDSSPGVMNGRYAEIVFRELVVSAAPISSVVLGTPVTPASPVFESAE